LVEFFFFSSLSLSLSSPTRKMERQQQGAAARGSVDDDDASIEEIGRGEAGAGASDLDDFLLLLEDDGGDDENDDELSSLDPRSLALFADVDTGGAGEENVNEDEETNNPFSDSYRGPGAIAAASRFSKGCLSLLRAFARSGELSGRCLAVATAVIEKINPADYTAWKLRWDCSRALSGLSGSSSNASSSSPLSSPLPSPSSSSFLAEEARLCARVAARSGFKNYQLWNHRGKIIAEAVGEGGGGGEGNEAAAEAAATEFAKLIAGRELAFASAALSDDAKNYHAWSHRCLVAGIVRCPQLWEGEREFAGGAIAEDPGSNSAWAHRAAAVGGLLSLLSRSRSSDSAADQILEEEFALASKYARERPHDASPAWAHARAVAGWKEEEEEEREGEAKTGGHAESSERKTRTRRFFLPLSLAYDARYASLAAEVLATNPGCVPALLLLHDAHALRTLWAREAGGKGEEVSSSSAATAAACRARLVEVDPTRRGLWSSIG